MSPHDRAQRPDTSQGSDPPSATGDGGGVRAPMGGSLPDIRPQNGGTYFLGRYRIVDEIGIGGMASVHLARMDGPGGFQKWVAIKKIHPHLVEDESFVQMFLDEARVAARISHPNVATVFDLGKHEDTYWIAMEYLHGEPLREVMRRTEELGTAMPPEIACRVIADAAEGLHAAHELLGKHGEKLGLVHRDVTPHNLFVTYDGVTKVVDFGIAKFSSRMSHTRAGTLKGKLAYMSPEQVHGEGIDRRTDIFALGVVLWELTTGQRLFRMESDLDTLAKVQECNVPRPSTLIRGYPVDLEKIVMKALAKNRGERFRTAREFSRALQSLLMRRGLFIASDEVAAYAQSIFNDRIQKREAHLRWAAEVTSTINVEQLLSKPKLGPEFTGASDVQPQAKPAGVRPAAGMPAPVTGPMADPETLDENHGFSGAPASAPPGLRSTGSSVATQARPPRPHGGQNLPQTGRGGSQHRSPPRPAAGMPAPQPYSQQQTGEGFEDDHPADGDGPTIQALPPMLDPLPPLHSHDSRGGPMRSEPPTLMEASPASETDGPTMMASPAGRAQMMAASNALASSALPTNTLASDEIVALEPDDDFEEEDQDETMVANTRGEASPLQAPPTFPQVAPAADTASPQGGATRRPPPPNFGPPASLGPQGPPIPNPLAFSPQSGGPGHGQPSHGGELAFNETMGLQQHGHQGHDPNGFPPIGAPQHDFNARSGPHPTGSSGQGDFIPRQSPRMQPTVPRQGAASYNNRTMTAQHLKRRPPMWVVAALSCSIALLIAGVVIAIVSSSSGSPAPKPSRSTAPSPGGSAGGSADPAAGTGSSAGPFNSARAAFDAVVAAQAGSSLTPPVVPSGAPTAAVTAPPAATAPPVVTAEIPPEAPPTPTPTPTAAAAAATTATAAVAQPPAAPRAAPRAAPQPAAAAPKKPAALGAITVVCMPKCNQIIDNGASLGPGHIFNRPVASGRHVLQLSAPNGTRKNLVVEVVPGQTKEVRMSMDK